MPRVPLPAVVALVAGVVLWAAEQANALPWPSPAGSSLAGLFLLVTVTRVAGAYGSDTQRRLRYAVAGVALTACAWFAGGAMLVGRPELLALSGLHIAVAWLAAGGNDSPGERRRGLVVVATTMLAVSLIALAALDAPGAPLVPLIAAASAATATVLLARGRPFGLVPASVGALLGLALALRLLGSGTWLALGREPTSPLLALLAGTAALGALPVLVALAAHLPVVWGRAVPSAPPALRSVLIAATLPAALALALIAARASG